MLTERFIHTHPPLELDVLVERRLRQAQRPSATALRTTWLVFSIRSNDAVVPPRMHSSRDERLIAGIGGGQPQ